MEIEELEVAFRGQNPVAHHKLYLYLSEKQSDPLTDSWVEQNIGKEWKEIIIDQFVLKFYLMNFVVHMSDELGVFVLGLVFKDHKLVGVSTDYDNWFGYDLNTQDIEFISNELTQIDLPEKPHKIPE